MTANTSETQIGFRRDINGLRAWAVIAVVLYHFGVPGFTGGFIGVDVFFVISGFLMTRIIVRGLSEGRFSLWRFYLDRARRIIPALAVLAMVLLIVGWFTLLSTDYRVLGKHVAASLAFLSNIVFWLEGGYFDISSKEKWLLHTWSLSVEWQFYLLLPLMLLGAWKVRPSRASIATVVAFGFAGSLALSILVSNSNLHSAAFYLLPTRAWEMLAGGLVYLLAHHWSVGARAKLLEALGFCLIITSIFVFDGSTNWPGQGALLPVAGATLVLIAAQSDSLWTGGRIAQWLGKISYSVYLWHWPVFVALGYLGLQDSSAAIALSLILTLVFGHLSYTLVETPTRRHLAQLRLSFGMISLAIASASVAAPGMVINQNNGFPFRLPNTVELVAQEANNINPRRNECMLEAGFKSPACTYGGGDLNAIVIGDSHAASVITAAYKARLNISHGVMELSYSGCPTLFGVKRHPNYSRQDYQCDEFNRWALKKLDEIPVHVPLIIMNRTSYFAIGPNEPMSTPERPPVAYFTKPYSTPAPEFLEEFSEHLVDTTCSFAKQREVYLVRPTPEMGIDVPKFMSRAMMLGTDANVSISLEAYHARHAAIWAAQDEASRRCGVKILDPLPYLCEDGQCNGSKNGRPLYFDEDHLSEYGNRLLIPMFAKFFTGGAYQHANYSAPAVPDAP